ncbi:MAG: phage portal protein [Nitratireductor sp.]
MAAVKEWFRSAFGGDNRGAPLVMEQPRSRNTASRHSKMDLSVVRDVAEERVCASLGIPAAVVGFGAGLQTAKVGATMKELRQLAWSNSVIPMLNVFADEINRSLLPEFSKGKNEAFAFDTDEVKALGEDQDKAFERWSRAVQGGWAMVAEAREAAGLPVDDSHRIYLRPYSAIEVPAGQPPRSSVPVAPKLIKQGHDHQGHDHQGHRTASEQAIRAGRAYVDHLAKLESRWRQVR